MKIAQNIKELLGLERNVLVLGCTSAVATFANLAWMFFFPIYLQDMGLNAIHISSIYTIASGFQVLMLFPSGYLGDKYGSKNLIVLGSFVASLSPIFLLFVETQVHLRWLMALLGLLFSYLGFALLAPNVSTVIVESVPEDRKATAVASFSTMSQVLAVSAPAIGAIMSTTHGYNSLFLLAFLLTFLVAIVRIPLLQELTPTPENINALHKRSAPFRFDIRFILSRRNIMTLLIAYAIYEGGLSLTGWVLPLYASSELDMNKIEIGTMFSLTSFSLFVFQIPFGKLSDKIGRRKVVFLSWLGETAALAMFIYATNPIIGIAIFGIRQALGQMDLPARSAWIGDFTSPQNRATIYGLFGFLLGLVSIPLPIIGGGLYSLDPKFPFFVQFIFSIVAITVLLKFTSGDLKSVPKHKKKD